MIIPIILLILIVLLIAMVILFIFFVLMPSLAEQTKIDDDPIISQNEKKYFIEDNKNYETTSKKAFVLCSCNKEFNIKPVNFNEKYSCFMVKELFGSGTDCKYACIGLGDCVKACPQNAISIINKTAVISDLCCGCGICENKCPQNIIKLIEPNEFKSMKCACKEDENLTSCTKKEIEQNVEWTQKKYF